MVKSRGELAADPGDAFGVKSVASSLVAYLRDGDFITPARVAGYPKLLIAIYLAVMTTSIVVGRNPAVSHYVVATDYAKCVAASSLALKGRAADAYDDQAEVAAERAVTGDPSFSFLIWDYPPPFLLFVLPASMVRYGVSLAIWTLVTFAAYLMVMGTITTGWDAWWPIIGFPGVFVTMLDGQNGFLTLALLAGGLMLLERRPIVAGLLLGMLCYKPQFGILLPLLLYAGGYRKTFLSAAATVVALIMLTIALFGVGAWRAFIAQMPEINQWLFVQGVGFFKMQSVFGAARLWHASMMTASLLQATVSIAAAAAAWWMWRKPVALQLKCAMLIVGALLLTPYVLDYDLVLLAAPIAWIATEGLRSRFLPWEPSILFLAWLTPMWSRWMALFYLIPIGPLVLSLMLIAIIRRAMTIPGGHQEEIFRSKHLNEPNAN
jgi:hypothetical protein